MRLVVPLALSGLLLAACGRSSKTCEVCQRAECTGFAFRMTLATGKKVETCCPRCGLDYLIVNHPAARTLQATDYSTGQLTDATKALYVSGSDVSHCASMEARRDAYGCCMIKGYDRCLPSLIAFATLDAAQGFQKQHGGTLVTFSQLESNPTSK